MFFVINVQYYTNLCNLIIETHRLKFNFLTLWVEGATKIQITAIRGIFNQFIPTYLNPQEQTGLYVSKNETRLIKQASSRSGSHPKPKF